MIYKKLLSREVGVIILLVFVHVIVGDLKLSLKCGEKLCNHELQYCNQFSNACDNCSKICERGRNYDEVLCVKHCQDFLHSKRLTDKGDGKNQSLQDEVNRLQNIANISIVLSSIALIITVLFACIAVYNCVQKKSFKRFAAPFYRKKKPSNNNKDSTGKGGTKPAELRIEMPSQPSSPASDGTNGAAVTPQTVCTTLSRRGAPAEDRALDYAYDNRAMTPPTTTTTAPKRY